MSHKQYSTITSFLLLPQAFIYKYIPIIGPVLGSAFILGLYVTARLLRGDLTDRLKMMDAEEEKRRRTALREARIAFLEEEIPALVAKGTDITTIKYVTSVVTLPHMYSTGLLRQYVMVVQLWSCRTMQQFTT